MDEEKDWIVKTIVWALTKFWPLVIFYLIVHISLQIISIYQIGWPTWFDAFLNTFTQPLKISEIVNLMLIPLFLILGLSVAARRLLQANQQLKQHTEQIKQQNKQISSLSQ